MLVDSDEIQESLYDLFNQRFTSMSSSESEKERYFSTVSLGARLKLCEISPNFQCVVVMKEEDMKSANPAFLNRFEKYSLNYPMMITEILSLLPKRLRAVIEAVQKDVWLSILCYNNDVL